MCCRGTVVPQQGKMPLPLGSSFERDGTTHHELNSVVFCSSLGASLSSILATEHEPLRERYCSSHPRCSGLAEGAACCPTEKDVMLECCDEPTP